MKIEKFIPISYDTFDYNGINHVKIYGRTIDEKTICIIDTCPIYTWAILSPDATESQINELKEKAKSIYIQSKDRTTKIEKIEIHNKKYLGKDVKALKIFATNYKDLKEIPKNLNSEIIQKYRGHDLNFITYYIIEKEIKPMKWYEISGKEITEDDYDEISTTIETNKILKLESLKQIEDLGFEPKTLAFDIETDSLNPDNGEMLMISIVGKNFKKVITWKKQTTMKDYVEFVDNEKELIKKFIKIIKEKSPDFIVGYNTDGFDLPYIKRRASINKIKFNLSLDNSEPKISKGIPPTVKISGITHIDLYKFIKTTYAQYMQAESLSLNSVAKEFLENSKTDFQLNHSSKILDHEWDKYYEYNLQDSILTYQLFEKFWPDMIELSKVIEEPIFEITRNGLSKQIESYILHNLKQFNEIPEKKPGNNETSSRLEQQTVEGAFVYEPTPGIYENLAMFDFTSMHTSIIITHNIGKETLISDIGHPTSDIAYETPEIDVNGQKRKFHFSKKGGFFPEIIKGIFEKRKQYKEEYKKNPNIITKARSNAFKVLSASAHGYIGFSGARYYSWEASSAVLAFVRKYNQEIIQKIKDQGQNVIYGDTDSVAFTRNGKTKDEIIKLLEELNSELPGVMHLELEGFFKRGIWVSTRSGETGAKKKYAMLSEDDKIKIKGFETVRRDWCQLARKTQSKILEMILISGNEKEALKYVKEKIKDLKERRIPKEDLILITQLKKPISKYKSISPHVTAAIKMKERGEDVSEGTLISYYIGEAQGKLIRDKALLPDESGPYDISYYLEKQVYPAIESIFDVFNISIKEEVEGKKQESLNKWF